MILRNLQWQSLAQIGGRGVMLLIHLFLPLWMGWSEYGLFMFVWVWLAVLAHPFIDGGINPLITGDLARGQSDTVVLGVTFRMLMALCSLMAVTAVTLWIDLPVTIVGGLFLWFFAISLGMTGMAVFRGFERMEIEAMLSLAMRLTILIGMVFLYFSGWLTPTSAAILMAMVASLMLASMIPMVRRLLYENGLSVSRRKLTSASLNAFVRRALPLTILMLSTVVYLRVDSIMLGMILDETAVANYQIPFRLVEAAFMLPIIVAVALYPQLARAEPGTRRSLLSRAGVLVIVAGTLVALVLWIGGRFLIPWLYGDAGARSLEILLVLCWAIPLAFCAQYLARVLPLYEAQGRLALLGMGGLVLNVAINAVLIPRIAEIGAAVATIATQAFMAISAVILVFALERCAARAQREHCDPVA